MVRAGLLVRRCTGAEVSMVEARPVISGLRWMRYVTVELGALAVTAVRRSC
jgi:hypothetical protein